MLVVSEEINSGEKRLLVNLFELFSIHLQEKYHIHKRASCGTAISQTKTKHCMWLLKYVIISVSTKKKHFVKHRVRTQMHLTTTAMCICVLTDKCIHTVCLEQTLCCWQDGTNTQQSDHAEVSLQALVWLHVFQRKRNSAGKCYQPRILHIFRSNNQSSSLANRPPMQDRCSKISVSSSAEF